MELKRQLDEAKKLALPRTAVLWGGEDFLETAVESILTSAKNWKVIKILDDHDVRTLAREVEKIHPEIVFVNLGDSAGNLPTLGKAVEDFPELKIIAINPKNNRIEIYSRRVIWIKEPSDLLSLINECSGSTPEGGEK